MLSGRQHAPGLWYTLQGAGLWNLIGCMLLSLIWNFDNLLELSALYAIVPYGFFFFFLFLSWIVCFLLYSVILYLSSARIGHFIALNFGSCYLVGLYHSGNPYPHYLRFYLKSGLPFSVTICRANSFPNAAEKIINFLFPSTLPNMTQRCFSWNTVLREPDLC